MKKGRYALLGALAGAGTLVVLCALALGLLLSCDLLYRLDMKLLDIPSYSGYDPETVLRNYHAAAGYLNPFKEVGTFTLPDLAVSPQGAQHFAEVRQITNAVFLLGGALLLPVAAFFIAMRRSPGRRPALLAAGTTMLALPALVLAGVALDPDRAFTLFHEIFFDNDYWIFSWDVDQVIRILPMDFFLHCAVFIALFWLAAGALSLLRAKKSN